MLSIRLLGRLDVSYCGQTIEKLQNNSLQSFFAYLLLYTQTPQPRSQVACQYWPDISDTQAKTKLRRELYRLKQVHPVLDQCLMVTPKTIQWQPQSSFRLDVTEFERAISQSATLGHQPEERVNVLRQAVSLYEGDLLPTCYEEWIFSERERLRQLMLEGLSDLSLLLAQQGHYREAIRYCQYLLQMDPLMEKAYLSLMKLYAQQGDRATALQKYHQCMTILREELGIDPSPETRQFYEQLLLEQPDVGQPTSQSEEVFEHSKTSPTSTQSGATPTSVQIDWGEAPDISFFHGRSEEIKQLQTWIMGDRSRLVAVLGMGGIGKTSLTAKIAQILDQDFDRIIWRSLRNAPPLETLLSELVPFLSDQQDTACSVPRFMHWLRQSRCLVILDNLETILKEGERAGQFREEYHNYGELLQVVGQGNHQSCLVVTSREKPAEISTFEGINSFVQSLQLAGSPEAALALLNSRSLMGTQAQKEQLSQRYGHSPLALQIVGGSIRDVFGGDISLFLAEDTALFNGAKKLLDLQFARLIPLEKTVMFWLAINREWTSITDLITDIYPRCSKVKLLEALESLCWRSLIERRGNTYTQQPVVMEYVTLCLLESIDDELSEPQRFDEKGPTSLHLSHYALLKTTVKDFVRSTQGRLILEPILESLLLQFGSPTAVAAQFQSILAAIRQSEWQRSSYVGGNLLNLCCQGQLPVKDIDFSDLTIRQAYLQGTTLHHLDLSRAAFAQSVFTQAFGIALSVAFSPDGALLAMGDNNHNLQLWRIGDGQPLMTLRGHRGWVWSIAFSPDGQTLVSGSVDYTVRLWDVSSGACLKTLQGHNSVIWSVAFSPDGKTVASGSEDQTAKLWTVKTGACWQTLGNDGGCVRTVTFDRDGKTLVTGHTDQAIRQWDIESGERLNVFQGHVGPVWAVDLSPDGQWLASAGADQTVRLWNLQSGDCLSIFEGHTDQVWAVAFSPDGHRLASGSNDRTVRLWNIQTESCLNTFLGHTDQVWSVAFSPDGHQLASGGFDQTIRLWDLETNQCLQTLHGYTNCIRSLVFEPEQSTLMSGGDDSLVRLWDSDSGTCLQTFTGHRSGIWGAAYHPNSVAISPEGGPTIASGGFDQTIRLWNRSTGQCIHVLEGNAGWIHCLAFHPQGHLLASGSIQPIVRIWDLATGQCCQQLQGHTDQIWSVAFSPDGRYLASTGADHLVKLWAVDTGECVQTFKGHTDWMYAVAFVPIPTTKAKDVPPNYQLASASGDRTIKLWDLQTGECLQTLEGHTGWVYSLAAHPSGTLLVSSSHDHTARIWDLQTGKCLHVLPHEASLWAMALHPQGHLIACSGEDEKITLWDVDSGECHSRFQIAKPYAGMRITGVTGLTDEQKATLQILGAIE